MGESGVGKTSLIRRYVRSYFDEGYLATIGTTVSKHVELVPFEDGRSVEVGLTIWDIMGSRKVMELLGDAYFYGARGALAVFDVWSWVKSKELANLCARDDEDLLEHVEGSLDKMGRRKDLLMACLKDSELPWGRLLSMCGGR